VISKEGSNKIIQVLALLQARVSSSRLPEKVLKPILGKAMVLHQIERLQRCRTIEKLVVVTSDQESDTPLVELLEQHKIECYRGNLNDVLDRYFQAAKCYEARHIVRLTGDCPLIDPEIVDQVVSAHVQGGDDYTSNVLPPTFPDGLDVEVLKFNVLQTAWQKATLQSDREHVTSYINQHPEQFKLGNVSAAEDLSMLRWTVDEPGDFAFVCAVYEKLYPGNHRFTTKDIVTLLKNNPELTRLNENIGRNEGFEKSRVDKREGFIE